MNLTFSWYDYNNIIIYTKDVLSINQLHKLMFQQLLAKLRKIKDRAPRIQSWSTYETTAANILQNTAE